MDNKNAVVDLAAVLQAAGLVVSAARPAAARALAVLVAVPVDSVALPVAGLVDSAALRVGVPADSAVLPVADQVLVAQVAALPVAALPVVSAALRVVVRAVLAALQVVAFQALQELAAQVGSAAVHPALREDKGQDFKVVAVGPGHQALPVAVFLALQGLAPLEVLRLVRRGQGLPVELPPQRPLRAAEAARESAPSMTRLRSRAQRHQAAQHPAGQHPTQDSRVTRLQARRAQLPELPQVREPMKTPHRRPFTITRIWRCRQGTKTMHSICSICAPWWTITVLPTLWIKCAGLPR